MALRPALDLNRYDVTQESIRAEGLVTERAPEAAQPALDLARSFLVDRSAANISDCHGSRQTARLSPSC